MELYAGDRWGVHLSPVFYSSALEFQRSPADKLRLYRGPGIKIGVGKELGGLHPGDEVLHRGELEVVHVGENAVKLLHEGPVGEEGACAF